MSKILYGMPTLIECESLIKCIDLCKELGLDFIEINMNLPQYQKWSLDILKIKEKIKKEDIFFTIHLDENLNVCDFNKDIAKAYMESVLYAIEIAKELNIPILNMHMSKGVYFTLPNERVYLFSKYKELYLEKLIEFREACEKSIGKYNIKICIENCDGYKQFMIEGIEVLLKSEVFALTWDIGHDYAINNKDSKFIESNIERLKHMHVHDATRLKNHLALGEGEVNIKRMLNFASENNCRCVLETKTIEGLKKSVTYIRENI